METISSYFPSDQTNNMTIANRKSLKRPNDESVNVAVYSNGIETHGVKSEPQILNNDNNLLPGIHNGMPTNVGDVKQVIMQGPPPKKKRDRFNGTSEEEVMKMTLPDRIKTDLDILIIGINPGLTAAYVGHHYAGPGNHFWKCLHSSGLIPEPLTAFQDEKSLEYGIGLCNIVNRTTRSSNNLSRKEIKEGAEVLTQKIKQYKPKIAVFNGKGIYEVFSGNKKFSFGKQPITIPGTDTLIFVMPSSSARCSQLPRAADKVPFYVALKKLRDHLCGLLPDLKESEVCFPGLELKVANRTGTEGDSNGRKSRANGQFIDQSGVNLSYSNESSSTPSRLMQGGNSSDLPGYSDFSHMGFQSHPIHSAFSSAAATQSGTVPVPCTASSNLNTSTAQVTSQYNNSVPIANNQSSRKQSVPKRNDETNWARPTAPPVTTTETVSLAEGTIHIPCTSSAVLTSEWIIKHFSHPFQPPYNMNGSWPSHSEYGLNGKSLWPMGVVPGHGYMKHEMPSDGYGSVPPSR